MYSSPAKKVLNFRDNATDEALTPMDVIEGMPLSSSDKISEYLSDGSGQSHGNQMHKQESKDPLIIVDDLENAGSVLGQRTIDLARPISSMSEPTRTDRDRPVPHRLVPSTSTERIMDILRERGLDVGSGHAQNSVGERKAGLLSESLEVVNEEEISGSEDEEEGIPRYSKDPVNSSTPSGAAKSDEERVQPQEHQGSQSEGMLSPAHLLFSVGSSPVHGASSSQELNRRASLTSLMSLPEGTFLGEARHKDGSLMSIVFQVCTLRLPSHCLNKMLNCS